MIFERPLHLTEIRTLRPRYVVPQAAALDWLAEAHARHSQVSGSDVDTQRLRQLLARYGAGPGRVDTRASDCEDFSHRDWSRMRLFDHARGLPGAEVRTAEFARAASQALTTLFAEDEAAPEHLIHVTCTGYSAPSAAQRLAAARGWNAKTIVTHAYHMGCYASIPAIRIGGGFLAAGRPGARAEIAHTEFCSIHVNPALTSPERLVIESLFADGSVRYSLREEAARGFRVLAVREELVPDSLEAMQWYCVDWGMQMVLSREVPRLIGSELKAFVARLLGEAGRTRDASTVFAIHPGGPRIIEQVAEILGLGDDDTRTSRAVLRTHGNMSSATLPHIWQLLDADEAVPVGATIVSLAFGPGLTLCGSVMEKTGAPS